MTESNAHSLDRKVQSQAIAAGSLRDRLQWLVSVYSMEFRRMLSYRADFWLQFLGTVAAQFGVAWFLWRAVFEYRDVQRIGQFSFVGLMFYYLAAPLLGRAIQGAEMGTVSDEIYQGTLTRYLIYPVSFFRYKFVIHFANSTMFLLQTGVALTAFFLIFGVPQEFSVTYTSVLQALCTVLFSTYLYFTVVSSLEMIAFWADNVWSLVVIVRFATGLLGGSMIPLSLFPHQVQKLMELLPFAYFVWFPVRTLYGWISWNDWLLGLGVIVLWSAFFTGLLRFLWNRGKYQYTGVGI